jgi:hypothetical protein
MEQGAAVRAEQNGVQSAMSATSSTGREAGSAARRPRGLERLLIVAAVAAVLVSVGAWFAMNRPGAGAEAAAGSSATATSGSAADASPGSTTGQADATASESSSAAPGDAPAGTGATGGSGSAAPSAAPPPLSPTTAFLTALTDSGLAPPVDDTQKLAMADDVCQELGYGSTYADVVRALTFAGASDAEAANFAGLAITHLCSQYEIG